MSEANLGSIGTVLNPEISNIPFLNKEQNIPNNSVVFFAYVRDQGIEHTCNMALAIGKYIDLLVVYDRRIESSSIFLNRLQESNIECVDISELKKVIATRSRNEPLLFHCNGFAHLRMAKKMCRPMDKILITVHCFRNARWFAKWVAILTYTVFFRSVDMWHFVCHKSRDEYFWYRKIPVNTCAFPLGVEELFMKKTAEPCVVKDLDGKEIEDLHNRVSIVCIARFQPWKRHLFLLRSLRSILNGNTYLILLGEGHLLKKVMNLAGKLGIREHVIFTGRVDRKTLHNILSYANLSVTVSTSETFGFCNMEPFCMDVPIVTTNVGISNSIIHDFYNGFILNTNCTENELLEKTKLALNFHRKVDNSKMKDLFLWDTFGRNTVECYNSMFKAGME